MLSFSRAGRATGRSLRGLASQSTQSRNKLSLSSLPFVVSSEISEALNSGAPVVALESAIITHGMPYPLNAETALKCEEVIRSTGAIPATIGMLSGQIHIGLDSSQIDRLADESNKGKVKLSRRDLAPAMARKVDGGTTIAGTMVLADLAGIKVFSTGGLGGVHRGGENSMDVSADLTELGRTSVAVVSAGAKSILDLGRTLEYLETQGVTVATYGTSRDFPAFFSRKSGFQSPYNIESPELAAQMLYAQHQLRLESGALIACPIPEEHEAGGLEIQKSVEQAIRESEENGMSRSGKDATPWLLRRVTQLTEGRSLINNVALIENTSRIGGEIAVHYAKLIAHSPHFSPSFPSRESPISPPTASELPSTPPPTAYPPKPLPPASLVIVGAAAVDVIAKTSSNSDSMHASTVPGTVNTSLGGVARNMAEAAHRSLVSLASPSSGSIASLGGRLSQKGKETLLVAPLGNDAFGTLIRTEIEIMGMRSDGFLVSSASSLSAAVSGTAGSKEVFGARRSPVCNMILSANGALLGGVADFSALDGVTPSEVSEQLGKHSPKLVAVDGNVPENVLDSIVSSCTSSSTPIWYEPTSKAKSTKILSALRNALSRPSSLTRPPVTYISPNTFELQTLFAAARESSIIEGREVPSLMSLDAWFGAIDALGLQAGIASDEFARIGGTEGAWLAKEGVVQMAVQMLPFFQHLVVKCGERGLFVAFQILDPSPASTSAWLSATHVPRHPSRPFVHRTSTGSLLILRYFPALTLPRPVVNVTGAGDSLVGSLLASILHGLESQGSDPFGDPLRLEEAVGRAQKAAVMSLMSEFAVSPALSDSSLT